MSRKQFFALLKDQLTGEEIRGVQTAYWIAKEAHRTQTRDSGERYFEHPRHTARILIEHCTVNAGTIILALLHDTLEDTVLPHGVIEAQFGKDMLDDVLLLSRRYAVFSATTGTITRWEEKTKAVYYGAIAEAEQRVRLVKVADRIDNLRSMTREWPKERRRWYQRDTKRTVLPIAEATDTGLADELKKLVNQPI